MSTTDLKPACVNPILKGQWASNMQRKGSKKPYNVKYVACLFLQEFVDPNSAVRPEPHLLH